MATSPLLPKVQAPIAGPGGITPAEWYRFFQALRDVVGLDSVLLPRIDALEAEVAKISKPTKYTGPASVRVINNVITLLNDLQLPDPSSYYGTDENGIKGWHPIPDADGLPYPFLTDQDGNQLTDQAGNPLQSNSPEVPWEWIAGTPTTLDGYGITDAATAAQGALADTAVQPSDLDDYQPIVLDTYTVATLPAAAPAYRVIMVTDLTGGMEPCWSDGTNWRRYSDRSIAN